MIEKHYLESTGGKTYAELDREDPLRQTAMTASFLRASRFTSVVSFGVAAMALRLGSRAYHRGLRSALAVAADARGRLIGRSAPVPSRRLTAATACA